MVIDKAKGRTSQANRANRFEGTTMVSIFQAMKSLLGSGKGPVATRSARLGLETLEAREVPAVVSAVIKTNSVGQKYLDIRSNDAASRVTLRHPTASDGWNVNRDILVVRDEAK